MTQRRAMKRVLYVSSRDRVGFPGGDAFDFFVDMENTVSLLEPEFADSADRDVKISLSVSQLMVPFFKGSRGFVDRVPAYRTPTPGGNALRTPQVEMLRLHTDIVHQNMTPRGHSSAVLQIPFMDHYAEPELAADDARTFSRVTYSEENDQHTGRFELLHGLESLNYARFWITDEGDRLLRTNDSFEVYITLTLYAESGVQERRHRNDLLAHVRQLVHLNRLLLVQGDSKEDAKRAIAGGERSSGRRSDRKRKRREDTNGPFL